MFPTPEAPLQPHTAMRPLPKQYILLRGINGCIKELFATGERTCTLRLTDVYDYITHKEPFRTEFPTPESFSRFMRRMYDEGAVVRFIPNCHADTTVHHHYQWYFYPPARNVNRITVPEDKNEAVTVTCQNDMMPWGRRFVASNGVAVRSTQELHIINKLLSARELVIFYERPLELGGHKRYPDFTIYNRRNSKLFYWEHFGMTGNAAYADEMVEKIRWYKRNGYNDIADGGSLIVTIYHDDNQFTTLTDKKIAAILAT